MGKYIKRGILTILAVLIIPGIGLGIYAYRGTYLGGETSPNNNFILRYYSSINPFKMHWSMPGGSSCKPAWLRLYDKSGKKLKELYTTDCSFEGKTHWLDNELLLPDGKTILKLPSRAR